MWPERGIAASAAASSCICASSAALPLGDADGSGAPVSLAQPPSRIAAMNAPVTITLHGGVDVGGRAVLAHESSMRPPLVVVLPVSLSTSRAFGADSRGGVRRWL